MGLQNLLTLHGDHVRSCWGRSSRRGDGGCQGCLLVFSGGKEGSKLPDLQAQDFRSEHAPAKGGRKNTCMLVHSNGETRAVRSYVEPLAFTGSNKGRVNRSEKERVGWYFLWLVTRDHAADQYPANPFAISTRLLSKQSSKSSRARAHTHTCARTYMCTQVLEWKQKHKAVACGLEVYFLTGCIFLECCFSSSSTKLEWTHSPLICTFYPADRNNLQ